MKRNRIKTLEGIARILGVEGFKRYAKDYGNSRVNLDGDVIDVINLLESYRDDEKLLSHFNYFRCEMSEKYSNTCTEFYETDVLKEQNQREINEFGYIVSM